MVLGVGRAISRWGWLVARQTLVATEAQAQAQALALGWVLE